MRGSVSISVPVFLITCAIACVGVGLDACSDSGCPRGSGVTVRFDPTLAPRAGASGPENWLAFPFPSDHRRTASGSVLLSDFPNPFRLDLLDDYFAEAEKRDGFGTNSAVHFLFDGPIDVGALATDPGAFIDRDAPLQLIDVTPTSPEYGTRRPLRWHYFSTAGSYVPAPSLAVAPAWGFPLRPETTYALIITTALHGEDGAPIRQPLLLHELLAGEADAASCDSGVEESVRATLTRQYDPLALWLADEGIAFDSIAVATVFTTQTPMTDLAAIRAQITDELPAPAAPHDWAEPYQRRTFRWTSNSADVVTYHVMEGRFSSPNYELGEVPYTDEGQLNLTATGPAPVRYEDLRFVVTFPEAPPALGRACYPIVEVGHGTGGDAYSFVDDGTAGRLAARGLAAISIDQPLHGLRSEGRVFDVDLASFNFLNPSAAAAVLRQSAIDTFSLTRFVRESLSVPATIAPGGTAVCFDPEHVLYFGHSQGGITGALAAALERDIQAWVLSAAGGGLSITLVEGREDLDTGLLIGTIVGLAEDEELCEEHPLMTLAQHIVEVTDPINYAPYWLALAPSGSARSVLATSGLHDQYTPYRTANAMAVAGRIPPVTPLAQPVAEYELLGMTPVDAPVSSNLGGRTAGFLQWGADGQRDDHFLIFHRPEAINASMRFLQSAAYEGVPVIERDPAADVR